MTLGARIEERRKAIGLSQAELARRVGVRQSTMNSLINGDSRTSRSLLQIARELRTSAAYLTGASDDPNEGVAPEAELYGEDRELIDCFHSLSDKDRGVLLHLARSLPKHDRVASPPNPAAGLPPASALAQMFEGMLAQLDPEHPGEHAELLARRLPSALAQLTDLLPAQAPPVDAKPQRRRPTPAAVQPS